MLIDATHAEETRVVVVDGTKVEEFDFETVNKRQLAGNIYLAKVTRVEPSLQAAFVDYGGNRHGFLAFAEIHPDYYQIPAADRKALLEEERQAAAAESEESEKPKRNSRRRRSPKPATAEAGDVVVSEEIAGMGVLDPAEGNEDASARIELAEEAAAPVAPVEAAAEDDASHEHHDHEEDGIESVAEEDVAEEISLPRKPRARRYKIQEVIKVRQIMLVQVVKEERGNKGAALTTYLSLAGRYCVLMPNTARGGGISRKITNAADRKKLKDIASELEVPEGAGLIIRTAGSQRTRTEIRRDYEYLMRLWEQIRELTFKSIAPAPVYEEGDLIKRTIRDIYSKEIDEVLVEGDRGYRTAKDFMKMIMPSHGKNVKHYTDQMPLFARYQVESYLGGMFNPVVQLKSGGYIVIGVTEALVAIDVNSGRSTREHNIEDTALRTNAEAADEVARQLRLRDLAGLIVVDFIDMEEHRNNRTVERRLKEALRADRARIQVGRISHFGLLEMSRQRMRPGVLEGSSVICPHCAGAGTVRSTSSIALHVLRVLEDTLIRNASFNMTVKTRSVVALYILNQKRAHLRELEERFGVAITVLADDSLTGSTYHAFERGEPATPVPGVQRALVRVDSISPYDSESLETDEDSEEETDTETDTDGEEQSESAGAENGAENGGGRRRRRRRRGRNRESTGIEQDAPQPADDALAAVASINGEAALPGDIDASGESESESDSDQSADGDNAADEGQREGRGKRRRSRRGNRRGPYGVQRDDETGERNASGAWIKTDDGQPDAEFAPFSSAVETSLEAEAREATHTPEPEAAPVSAPEFQPTGAAEAEPMEVSAPSPAPVAPEPIAAEPAPAAVEAPPVPEPVHREVEVLPEAPPPPQKRGGWWQRAKSTISGA